MMKDHVYLNHLFRFHWRRLAYDYRNPAFVAGSSMNNNKKNIDGLLILEMTTLRELMFCLYSPSCLPAEMKTTLGPMCAVYYKLYRTELESICGVRTNFISLLTFS
jgi:hypothetical protein